MHDLNAALTTTLPFLTRSTGLRDVNDRTLGDWYLPINPRAIVDSRVVFPL
jgi:hypothetical protein